MTRARRARWPPLQRSNNGDVVRTARGLSAGDSTTGLLCAGPIEAGPKWLLDEPPRQDSSECALDWARNPVPSDTNRSHGIRVPYIWLIRPYAIMNWVGQLLINGKAPRGMTNRFAPFRINSHEVSENPPRHELCIINYHPTTNSQTVRSVVPIHERCRKSM